MRKISEIFITVREKPNSEHHELCVIAGDGFNDTYVTLGFEDVKECTEYAELLAKSLGLPKECIDKDVLDTPHLTLVQ